MQRVDTAPGGMSPASLAAPTIRGMVYIQDFNARHPALGDPAGTVNRNGTRLLEHTRRNQITRWDTGGATHAQGGTLESGPHPYIWTRALPSEVYVCSALFSDHICFSIHYFLVVPHRMRAMLVLSRLHIYFCPVFL